MLRPIGRRRTPRARLSSSLVVSSRHSPSSRSAPSSFHRRSRRTTYARVADVDATARSARSARSPLPLGSLGSLSSFVRVRELRLEHEPIFVRHASESVAVRGGDEGVDVHGDAVGASKVVAVEEAVAVAVERREVGSFDVFSAEELLPDGEGWAALLGLGAVVVRWTGFHRLANHPRIRTGVERAAPDRGGARGLGDGRGGLARVVVALAEASSPTATFEVVVVFLGRTYSTRIAPVANPAQKTAAPNTPRRATSRARRQRCSRRVAREPWSSSSWFARGASVWSWRKKANREHYTAMTTNNPSPWYSICDHAFVLNCTSNASREERYGRRRRVARLVSTDGSARRRRRVRVTLPD